MRMTIDCKAVIRRFGGATWLRSALVERTGRPLSLQAVRKWAERNSIPGWAQEAMMVMPARDGSTIDLKNFHPSMMQKRESA